MSTDQKLEEGSTVERRRKSCYYSMVEALKKIGFRRLPLVSTLYAAGVLLDYLVVYTVTINDDDKCIELDQGLGVAAFACRSLLEILNVIIFTGLNFKKTFQKFKPRLVRKEFTVKYILKLLLGIAITGKEFPDFLMLQQLVSIILVALVCQVMLMISLTSSNKGLILIALYYLLGLHIPRLCVVITIMLKRPKTSSSRFFTKLFRLFFFVYIYSIQFFAALWYLPAMYEETLCWREAYRNFTGRSYNISVSDCPSMTPDEVKFVGNYCSADTTKYEFGIYGNVRRFGILRTENPLLLIFYFSRWALQCLSSFAQGIEAGVNVWQNIFIIFIIVYAVFMFFFLIGEVQSENEKFAKLKPKLREKKQWMEIKKISEDLKSQIRKNERNKWPETTDVNIENMFNNLPEEVSGKLSRQLCLKRIKKVVEFNKWSDASLEDLCDHIKPVFYAKGTRVIREGDPIDEMIFVVQGVLWTYHSRERTTSSQITSHCNRKNNCLEDGDFHGEELVNCIRTDPYSFNPPTSTKTIQAGTNVEAFVIMVYDLKNVFTKKQPIRFIQLRWRFKRHLRLRRNAQIPAQDADSSLRSLLKNKRLVCSSCALP